MHHTIKLCVWLWNSNTIVFYAVSKEMALCNTGTQFSLVCLPGRMITFSDVHSAKDKVSLILPNWISETNTSLLLGKKSSVYLSQLRRRRTPFWSEEAAYLSYPWMQQSVWQNVSSKGPFKVAHWREAICMQLVVLREKVYKIRWAAETQTYTYWWKKVPVPWVQQEVYAIWSPFQTHKNTSETTNYGKFVFVSFLVLIISWNV